MKLTHTRFFLAAILSVIMVFNSTATVLMATHNLQEGQVSIANESDALLICTGSSVKWISQSAYFDLGKVVEVQAPSDLPTKLYDLDCYSTVLLDPYLDELLIAPLLLSQMAISTPVLNEPEFSITSAQYSSSLSRAPPSFLQ